MRRAVQVRAVPFDAIELDLAASGRTSDAASALITSLGPLKACGSAREKTLEAMPRGYSARARAAVTAALFQYMRVPVPSW